MMVPTASMLLWTVGAALKAAPESPPEHIAGLTRRERMRPSRFMSTGSPSSDAGRGAPWSAPGLEKFADRVVSILSEHPGMVALRRRLSDDLRRSVDLDQLTRQLSRDVAAGGNLSELQAQLTDRLRGEFAEAPALQRFRDELSSALRIDPSFTQSVRDLLGSRAMPVGRWTPLLRTLRQRTGVETDVVAEEMLSAAAEVEADDSEETSWLLRLSGAGRAALLLATTELAWALSQIAVISAGHREASPQVQQGVQALFALIAILVALLPPDDDDV